MNVSVVMAKNRRHGVHGEDHVGERDGHQGGRRRSQRRKAPADAIDELRAFVVIMACAQDPPARPGQ